MRKLTRDMRVSSQSNNEEDDTHGFAFKLAFVYRKRHLNSAMKTRRLEMTKWCIASSDMNQPIIYPRKIFTDCAIVNLRDNRYITHAYSKIEDFFKAKHSAQVRVLGIATSNGKVASSYFQTQRKANTDAY